MDDTLTARVMIQQLDLDAFAAEQHAADQAIARAAANTDDGWNDLAYNAILSVARTTETFISDACWATGLPEPHEPRALGGVMRRAARDGLIVGTDEFRPSRRVGCHAMPRRVWKSLVFEGDR